MYGVILYMSPCKTNLILNKYEYTIDINALYVFNMHTQTETKVWLKDTSPVKNDILLGTQNSCCNPETDITE